MVTALQNIITIQATLGRHSYDAVKLQRLTMQHWYQDRHHMPLSNQINYFVWQQQMLD